MIILLIKLTQSRFVYPFNETSTQLMIQLLIDVSPSALLLQTMEAIGRVAFYAALLSDSASKTEIKTFYSITQLRSMGLSTGAVERP